MNKPYKSGVIVGRFQTLHIGHEEMINKALELCDRVGIFIGSSQESRTEKNPFSYELRKEYLKTVFGDKISVFPLPDIGVGNNSAWGDYVLDQIEKALGELPDLIVTGKEERRNSWFDNKRGSMISILSIPKTIDISSTEMRKHFYDDDISFFQEYTNPLIWDKYQEMRKIILASRENKDTESI